MDICIPFPSSDPPHEGPVEGPLWDGGQIRAWESTSAPNVKRSRGWLLAAERKPRHSLICP